MEHNRLMAEVNAEDFFTYINNYTKDNNRQLNFNREDGRDIIRVAGVGNIGWVEVNGNVVRYMVPFYMTEFYRLRIIPPVLS